MLGPIKPIVFDLEVGDDLINSPTLEEFECLKEFFSNASKKQFPNDYTMIGNNNELYNVAACGHIIQMSIKKSDNGWPKKALILRIKRSKFPKPLK